MKVKVSDAERETLDYMVAMAEWVGFEFVKEERFIKIFLHRNRTGQGYCYCYSRDWAQAGPLIEREGISIVRVSSALWDAHMSNVNFFESGPTPLIAAMRCFVASRLGDEVDVPDDLVWDELIYDKGDE